MNNIFKKFTYPCIFLAFLMTSIGCAPKISTQVLMPAKSTDATGIRKVAVLKFSGEFGQQATSGVTSTLTSVEIDGRKYFTVVDRDNLQKLFNEMKFQRSGTSDTASAVALGKMIGAGGIYLGSASMSSSDSYYTETRSRCDKHGNCSEYSVSCTKRSADGSVSPRLINVATGQIVYSHEIGAQSASSHCSDSGYPLASVAELYGEAISNAMEQFRQDVAPYYTKVNITLMNDDNGIVSKMGKDQLKSGIDFAKAGRMDRACDIWNTAFKDNPSSISLIYDLGVCSEVGGDEKNALQQYNNADKLALKPVTAINDSLTRIKQRMDDKQKLKNQM